MFKWIALLFTGCGTAYVPVDPATLPPAGAGVECTSPCGVHAVGLWEGCKYFAEMEGVTLQKLAAIYDPQKACTALNGVELRTVEQERSMVIDGVTKFGSYYFGLGLMLLPRWPTGEGAYPHEIAHALDYRLLKYAPGASDCSEFAARGIQKAVEQVWDVSLQRNQSYWDYPEQPYPFKTTP
jgi:hypothetical protein